MSSNPPERPLVDFVLHALRDLAVDIDQLDQFGADRFGVNRTDLRAIELLGQCRAIGPTRLANTLHLTTAGMTTVIDRLERAGYARRRADPSDRRKVVVEATDLLIRREQHVFGELLDRLARLVGTYSDSQLASIRDFLEQTRDVVVNTYSQPAPRESAGSASRAQ